MVLVVVLRPVSREPGTCREIRGYLGRGRRTVCLRTPRKTVCVLWNLPLFVQLHASTSIAYECSISIKAKYYAHTDLQFISFLLSQSSTVPSPRARNTLPTIHATAA